MAKSALETYREALEKNRQMQEAITGGQPNEVVNNLDQEIKFQDDLAKLMKLENKQVQIIFEIESLVLSITRKLLLNSQLIL